MKSQVLNDQPINSKEEDLLKRNNFANKIVNYIQNIDAKDGFCIGIIGKWGTGKTSTINLVKKEIREDNYLIIDFNPWNYSNENDLYCMFFRALANEFCSKTEKDFKELGESIQIYADIASDVAAKINPLAKYGAKIIEFLRNCFNNQNILNSSNLEKQRQIIIKRLNDLNKKVIVVIDDIDRLSYSKIKLIFQLVGSVAKFPNIIYITLFDKEFVAKALCDINDNNGDLYLEKIIQLPIYLPIIRERDIQNIFYNKLEEVVNNYDITFESDYQQLVFSKIFDFSSITIRDVYRIVNVINFKCLLIGNELNFIDLVAITIIEIKNRAFYEWIKENKNTLINGPSSGFIHDDSILRSVIEGNSNEVKSLNEKEGQKYIDILNVLFPNWNSRNGAINEKNYRQKRRIAHRDYFDLYFSYGFDDDFIHKGELNKALYELNESELSEFIGKYSISNFIEEIKANEEYLSEERILILSSGLMNKWSSFSDKTESIFAFSNKERVRFLLQELLDKCKNKKDVYNLLNSKLCQCTVDSIKLYAELINSIGLSYGRFGANGVRRSDCNSIMPEELLDDLCDSFINKIHMLTKENDLFDVDGAYIIIYLYEQLNKDELSNYITAAKKDNLRILKYIQIYANRLIGSRIEWEYIDEYKKYVSDEEGIEAFNKCVDDKTIWNLSKEQIHRIVVYSLWIEGKRDSFGDLIDEIVIERENELLRMSQKQDN